MNRPTITILGIEGKKDKVFRRIFHIPIDGSSRRTIHIINGVSQLNYYVVMIQMNGKFSKQVVHHTRIVRRELDRVNPNWGAIGSIET